MAATDEPALFRDLWRGIAGATATGRAEPAPPDRPWPRALRWTRRVGLGRIPFGTAAELAGIGLAAVFIFAAITRVANETAGPGIAWTGAVELLVVVAATAPLALRERYPLAAWRLNAIAITVIGMDDGLGDAALAVAEITSLACLYTVAVRCRGEVTLGVLILSMAGAALTRGESLLGASVLVLLPLAAGYVVRTRQASRRELAEQERRHRDAEAVLKERQRIARELHDVVAHHMSMIAIQAEAAPYRVATVPDETRADLAEIRATALDALTEMRRILGVLRSENGAETAPQPGLDRLDELLANARAAGLRVTARQDGDLAGLPSGIGLTAYRILQEALSNAMRHAPGSRVEVEAVREDGILRLGVVNGPPEGVPTPSPPGGHGIVGMRERAAVLGGTLAAAPTSEGGFAVTATLPLPAAPAREDAR